ncbi:endo alpha-1,4 polygalactosaminidase [Streptomyces hirsutus]
MRRPAGLLAAPLALCALLLLAGCVPGPDPGSGSGAGRSDGPRWQPRPGTDWQWQLSGRLDTSVDVPVYDIDGFDHSGDTVARLHRDGRKVICYLSTGAGEDFRPDAGDFPDEVIGRGNGWEGERWLDIRRTDVLEPIMAERFDMCRDKGFDAVEPDNMDGYRNRTGFPLTAADQLRYNRLIARLAHERGLAVGLKNDLDEIPQLGGRRLRLRGQRAVRPVRRVRGTHPVRRGRQGRLPRRVRTARRPLLRGTPGGWGLSSLLKKYELGAWHRAC